MVLSLYSLRRFNISKLSKLRCRPRNLLLLSLSLALIFTFFFFVVHVFLGFNISIHPYHFAPQLQPQPAFNITDLASDPLKWLNFLHSYPHTERLGCREYPTASQSCVFSGLACINASAALASNATKVYFLDDSQPDGSPVPHDDWCKQRNSSTDPRYHASYYFSSLNHTFAPRRACLDAYFRTTKSLLGDNPAQTIQHVNWQPNLWLVDLENPTNDNNPNLFTDILWLLDVSIWQKSWDIHSSPFASPMQHLFQTTTRRLYLPQSSSQFSINDRNMYRMLYAMILQLNLTSLFPEYTPEQLQIPLNQTTRSAAPLFQAYPTLSEKLIFHEEQRQNQTTQLVCTPRLTVGAKIYDGAHERVCRNLRQQGYDLFGIKLPPPKHMGRVRYSRPPNSVIVLQRHNNRKISNIDDLVKGLEEGVAKHGATIEIVTTQSLVTAEDWVRTMSRAGVIISPHGNHLVGQIWMKRHR